MRYEFSDLEIQLKIRVLIFAFFLAHAKMPKTLGMTRNWRSVVDGTSADSRLATEHQRM